MSSLDFGSLTHRPSVTARIIQTGAQATTEDLRKAPRLCHKQKEWRGPLGMPVRLLNNLVRPVTVFVSTFCAGKESQKRTVPIKPDGGEVILGATEHEQVIVRLSETLGGSISMRDHAQTEAEIGLSNLTEKLRRARKIL